MTPQQRARVNAALDALPTSFARDNAEALAHCQSIGIRNIQERHLMGFGCQVGVFQRLGAQFGSIMSDESPEQQFFDVDVYADRDVLADSKARTLGKASSWTISNRELHAVIPGAMIYAFYNYSPKQGMYFLHGSLVRADEPTNWVAPRQSQYNDGYFWFVSDIPVGNLWRFK